MTCRYRPDCDDPAVAVVQGRIVCRHHAAYLIDAANMAGVAFVADPLTPARLREVLP